MTKSIFKNTKFQSKTNYVEYIDNAGKTYKYVRYYYLKMVKKNRQMLVTETDTLARLLGINYQSFVGYNKQHSDIITEMLSISHKTTSMRETPKTSDIVAQEEGMGDLIDKLRGVQTGQLVYAKFCNVVSISADTKEDLDIDCNVWVDSMTGLGMIYSFGWYQQEEMMQVFNREAKSKCFDCKGFQDISFNTVLQPTSRGQSYTDYNGCLLGLNANDNQPVIMDINYHTDKETNIVSSNNVIISGATGSGKTQYAKDIMDQRLVNGDYILIADPGKTNSYNDWCTKRGGEVIDIRYFQTDIFKYINRYVFEFMEDTLNIETKRAFIDTNANLVRLVACLTGIDNDEMQVIFTNCQNNIKNKRLVSFKNIAQQIKDNKDKYSSANVNKLSDFVSKQGVFFEQLDNTKAEEFQPKQLMVFDLTNVNEFIKAKMLIITTYLINKICIEDLPASTTKVVIVDEAHMIDEMDGSSTGKKLIQGMSASGRKINVGFVLISQLPSTLYGITGSESLDNFPVNICFGGGKAEPLASDYSHLNEQGFRDLKRLNKFECLLSVANHGTWIVKTPNLSAYARQ
jgi:AAA-like domain